MTHLTRTAERVSTFTWTYREDQTEIRARLMVEFLRRSALWAKAFAAPTWPFPDLVAAVDPAVRVLEGVVAQALATVPEHPSLAPAVLADPRTSRPCRTPELTCRTFRIRTPPLEVLRRGDVFGVDGTGWIEVDSQSLPRRNAEFFATRERVVAVAGEDRPPAV